MTKDFSLWSLADAIEWTRDQNNRRREEHIRDSRRINLLEQTVSDLEKIVVGTAQVLELYAESHKDLMLCMKTVDPTYKKQG